jgi:hypothetical protein
MPERWSQSRTSTDYLMHDGLLPFESSARQRFRELEPIQRHALYRFLVASTKDRAIAIGGAYSRAPAVAELLIDARLSRW